MIRKHLAQDVHAKENLLYMTESSTISEDDENTISEIESEAIFLFAAGSDTLTTCLSSLFHYLSEDSQCYQELTQEIRSTFHHQREIRSGPRLARCQYLRACLDETLRISPPVPGTLWREQEAESRADGQPLIIDGHIIPPGTEIGVNTYALHHNEEYFPEPFVFKPERWIPECVEYKKNTRSAFVPFSTGVRGCLGRAMAYQEAQLIVARILWHLDLKQAPFNRARMESMRIDGSGKHRGRHNEYPIRDRFGASHNGPWMVFHPREDQLNEVTEAR
ncbi:hypothetical protein JX265_008712 [Neoarthrinium moseri]|uniref:Cytochrome P450 n=1 Tax=Neoarthrinium moseri TaxID=1658444 RepID=A0A9Q0AM59_9PEZI|nr:uncharacterized protein JN550_008811 [Neoarthrinium moseri]KAI1848507.1 hypothetical protein JX266_005813 [Neoarthrinium moseri]KAI1863495.1 hypothetical protein JX265_008712 [Neoarthrinium moseri]KAI1864524.1 hypothetical protein JN550_008811 [Neoarthrinium moseri]